MQCFDWLSFALPTRAGQEPNEQVVESMMSEAPGPLNFTMFLTLFGEKLNGKSWCTSVHVCCARVYLCVLCACVLCVVCVCACLSTHLSMQNINASVFVVRKLFCWFPSLGTDPEDVIRNAFACFDEEATGHINEDR